VAFTGSEASRTRRVPKCMNLPRKSGQEVGKSD
jgi:hypothetical protein